VNVGVILKVIDPDHFILDISNKALEDFTKEEEIVSESAFYRRNFDLLAVFILH
jgi:hypothetical protein